MHRTATTATLLVTVAVSAVAAVSGCVTVQRPPSPELPSPPHRVSEPRPDGSAEPQVVQPPAREALPRTGPSRRASPVAPAPVRPAAPAASAAVPARPPRRAAPGPPRRPEPRRPERPAVPRPPTSVPQPGTDVCALGRTYGGWRAGSPEAAICESVHGR